MDWRWPSQVAPVSDRVAVQCRWGIRCRRCVRLRLRAVHRVHKLHLGLINEECARQDSIRYPIRCPTTPHLKRARAASAQYHDYPAVCATARGSGRAAGDGAHPGISGIGCGSALGLGSRRVRDRTQGRIGAAGRSGDDAGKHASDRGCRRPASPSAIECDRPGSHPAA